MENNVMMGLTEILGFFALGALLLALVGWRIAVQAVRRADALDARLAETESRLLDVGQLATALIDRLDGYGARLDRVQIRQERLDAASEKTGFSEAIALTRHGAEPKELIETCGLSLGEAQLVSVLYGGQHDESDMDGSRAASAEIAA